MNLDWTEYARCAGEDINTFFPDAGTGYARARRFCFQCPVRLSCLRDALDAESRHPNGRRDRAGMFGGATPEERGELARRHSPHSADDSRTINA